MNKVIPIPKGDRKYFVSEAAYQAYLKSEQEVAKEPLGITFDWRYFLKVLFGGLK